MVVEKIENFHRWRVYFNLNLKVVREQCLIVHAVYGDGQLDRPQINRPHVLTLKFIIIPAFSCSRLWRRNTCCIAEFDDRRFDHPSVDEGRVGLHDCRAGQGDLGMTYAVQVNKRAARYLCSRRSSCLEHQR